MSKVGDANRKKDIRFECRACGKTSMVNKLKKACPRCLADGWSLVHTFPVVDGPPVVAGTGRPPWQD